MDSFVWPNDVFVLAIIIFCCFCHYIFFLLFFFLYFEFQVSTVDHSLSLNYWPHALSIFLNICLKSFNKNVLERTWSLVLLYELYQTAFPSSLFFINPNTPSKCYTNPPLNIITTFFFSGLVYHHETRIQLSHKPFFLWLVVSLTNLFFISSSTSFFFLLSFHSFSPSQLCPYLKLLTRLWYVR